MQEFFSDQGVRTALVAIIAALLVQGVKRLQGQIAASKALARAVTLIVVAIGAFVADWAPDGTVTLATWWPVAWQGALGAEFSYQWILKWVGCIGDPAKQAPVSDNECGC